MSDRCYYCRCSGKRHNPVCPEADPVLRVTRINRYDAGWNAGRVYRTETDSHPTYLLGYGQGVCAAEEAENTSRYD